jgi:hypothetical protein
MAYPSCSRRSDEDDVGIETQGNSSFQTVTVGLYDVSADIGEQKNLAVEYPDRVKRMTSAIAELNRDVLPEY